MLLGGRKVVKGLGDKDANPLFRIGPCIADCCLQYHFGCLVCAGHRSFIGIAGEEGNQKILTE